MNNIFNKGDIVFDLSIDKVSFLITINTVIILNIEERKDGIMYETLSLETSSNERYLKIFNEEFDDYKHWQTNGYTTAFGKLNLVTEGNIESKIIELYYEVLKIIEKENIAKNQFRCPLTNEILTQVKERFHAFDVSSFYKNESGTVIYEKPSRGRYESHKYYHTEYLGNEYTFNYLGNGIWEEYKLVQYNNHGKYFPLLIKDIEIINWKKEIDIQNLLLKQKELEKCLDYNNTNDFTNLFPIIQPVIAKTVKMELVEVKPLDAPKMGLFNFLPRIKKQYITIYGKKYLIDENYIDKIKKVLK